MSLSLRWQAALVVAGLGLLVAMVFTPANPVPVSEFETAVSTQSVLESAVFATDPNASCDDIVPLRGGRLREGVVGRPNLINPLFAAFNPVDANLIDLLFDGLVRFDASGIAQPALAERWEVSEDGATVTFWLKSNLAFHDGTPVTTNDVAFTYGLMQTADFPGDPKLSNFWSTVAIEPISREEIRFRLLEPYSPFLTEVSRGILPQHLLQSESAQSLFNANHSFYQQPVGTGPFQVANGNWAENGRLSLTPTRSYFSSGSVLDGIDLYFYADYGALAGAFQAGEINSINAVPAEAVQLLLPLANLDLYSREKPMMAQLLFNTVSKSTTVTQTPAGRQALAFALDKQLLIDRAANGQGVPFDGPYAPTSWVYSSEYVFDYALDRDRAGNLVQELGWGLSADNGSIRVNEEGTPLTIRLLSLNVPVLNPLAGQILDQWAAAGITTEVIMANSLDEYFTALATGEYDVAITAVELTPDPDLYDFWSQEAITNGKNFGIWNYRRASETLEAGRQTWDLGERSQNYQLFQRLYHRELPAYTLFQYVENYGLSSDVQGAEFGKMHAPRDQYKTFAQWHYLGLNNAPECGN